ncbi:hypothetical protein OGAPHI_001307 [Ogataea philodendri]|uniref:C2H2-type domain-containing protein n=1 Tax=Ogataea philodendri TaxID=1378263 RepID=A0A9P8TA70_9ASCO|nr:uncharacterized protein OGAPHI_001307 [Ogataea philodendri]KAH3670791.1 hypothetical protein OGAPHI_001307 [Ogataea philodendri]
MSKPSYTCNSCSLAFHEAEEQRRHMKTDWHRYNLKRRVSHLPPINEQLFNDKVGSFLVDDEDSSINVKSKATNKQLTKKDKRRLEKEALIEKKNQLLELARQRQYQHHDTTKSELEPSSPSLVAKLTAADVNISTDRAPEPQELNTIADDIDPEESIIKQKLENAVNIPLEVCMFCNKESHTLDENVEHMYKYHGLYIPEAPYLIDKPGLIGYLSEKVGLGNVCLACQFQGRNIESVRQHMIAKGHCKIPYDTIDEKLEISEFYNFESSYGGEQAEGAADDWEDISDDGNVDSNEEESELDDSEDLYTNGYQLQLPNGQVAGHRSLMRYYRQNLRPERELTEGQGTLVAAETRHFVQQIDRKELQGKKRIWARQEKSKDLNDRRAAKFINHQAHYRDQLLQ